MILFISLGMHYKGNLELRCSLFYKSKYFFNSLHPFEYVNTKEHKQNENLLTISTIIYNYDSIETILI